MRRTQNGQLAHVFTCQRARRHRGDGGRPDRRQPRGIEQRGWRAGLRIENDHQPLVRGHGLRIVSLPDSDQLYGERAWCRREGGHRVQRAGAIGQVQHGAERLHRLTGVERTERLVHQLHALGKRQHDVNAGRVDQLHVRHHGARPCYEEVSMNRYPGTMIVGATHDRS